MALEWQYTSDSVDWDELSALYKAAPLGDKSPAHLLKVFLNSMFKCSVYEDLKLVGAGRALADGADCSYICDIAVMPSHEGSGLGKQIVNHLVEASRGHKKILLYAVPGKVPFYRKLGFLRMTTAMAFSRTSNSRSSAGISAKDDLGILCTNRAANCALRVGMACKTQNAAIAVVIARFCNAAGRPIPQMQTARRFVQRVPRYRSGRHHADRFCLFGPTLAA